MAEIRKDFWLGIVSGHVVAHTLYGRKVCGAMGETLDRPSYSRLPHHEVPSLLSLLH